MSDIDEMKVQIETLQNQLAQMQPSQQIPQAALVPTIAPPSPTTALEVRLAQVFTIVTQLMTLQQSQTQSLSAADAERQRRATADERRNEWIKLIAAMVGAIVAAVEIYVRGAK